MKQETESEKLFTARIPASLLEEFKQAAKAQDETASQAVRKFIRQYVKQANKLAQAQA